MGIPVVESHHVTRDTLAAVYRDFVNNYLNVAQFATDRRLTVEQARKLLELAQTVYHSPDPDA